MKIFGREPAAILAAIQATLALAVGFGALGFLGISTPADVAVLTGFFGAVIAAYLAYATNETLLAPVVELFKAVTAVAAIYGLHLSAEESALAITAIQALATAWHRGQVVPLESDKTFRRVDPHEAEALNDLPADYVGKHVA